MTGEVFNRVEKKFLITNLQYKQLLPLLKSKLIKDENMENSTHYTIQNIYYDTEDDFLIKHSLGGPIFKEKLRIRAYDFVNLESFVYIELKKKMKGVVNKRRSQIKLCEAYMMLNTHELPEIKSYHNKQVLKEILFFIKKYEVKAKTYVAYERMAYKSGEFRVTVDENIRTRNTQLRLEYGDSGEMLLEPGFRILEAKSNKGLPMWFVQKLSEIKLYNTSFSKYGKDYIRKNSKVKERGVYLCSKPYLVIQQSQPSQ